MNWRMVPTIAVALAIVAAALAVIGGSHDSSALDPVANAANATTRAGSVEFRMTGNVSAAGQSIPLNGGGAMDPQNLRARMSISTALPGLGQATIDEIMNGTAIYMHMPQQLASRLPGGKAWMKIDLQAFGKANGVDFQKALQGGGQQNPADMLGYLKAVGDSRVVGHEAIRGSATTHYSATIDIAKAADKLGDKKTAESLKQLEASMGLTQIPVDVWVDRSGLVRREQVKMSASQGGQSVAMDMTIDYLRFGVSVDATPPPDDQVTDLSSLLGSVGAGSGQP